VATAAFGGGWNETRLAAAFGTSNVSFSATGPIFDSSYPCSTNPKVLPFWARQAGGGWNFSQVFCIPNGNQPVDSATAQREEQDAIAEHRADFNQTLATIKDKLGVSATGVPVWNAPTIVPQGGPISPKFAVPAISVVEVVVAVMSAGAACGVGARWRK
jgi:hypothetical protein